MGKVRPLSERMNAPPTYTFGVSVIGSLLMRTLPEASGAVPQRFCSPLRLCVSAASSLSYQLHVVEQPLPSPLSPKSGFLVSTERGRGIELVERVRPHHTGLQLGAHLENTRALVGPDASREAVHGVVRFLDGFLERAEREHAQHRAEDLLLRDAMALGHSGKHGGFE